MKIFRQFFSDPLKQAQKAKEVKPALSQRQDARPTHWDALLAKCDLLMARDEIALMHRRLKEEAKQKGGEHVYKDEYVEALESFYDNPCVETARALLNIAPVHLAQFESCSPGGNLYSTNRLLRERDTPPSR